MAATFCGGQQLGLHLVDAEEAPHCLADRPGVAGEHDGVDPACPELLDQPPRGVVMPSAQG